MLPPLRDLQTHDHEGLLALVVAAAFATGTSAPNSWNVECEREIELRRVDL
jgi:hypothetical protein